MATVPLAPSQQKVCDALLAALPNHQILHVLGRQDLGRDAILKQMREQTGGVWLTMHHLLQIQQKHHPLALEESLYETIREAFHAADQVYLDGWDLLDKVVDDGCSAYPRSGYLSVISAALVEWVQAQGLRRLIIGAYCYLPAPLNEIAFKQRLYKYKVEDYQHFFHQSGMPATAPVDTAQIYRFAPHLDVCQLQNTGEACQRQEKWDTATILQYLQEAELISNVDLPEVTPIRFEDLAGMDDLIQQLLVQIVFPLEEDQLAQQYQLKPKRGVLLLGPPGTGKTTIGKALAHRPKGKFFLIDGTIISGSNQFYFQFQSIIEDAKKNAPAVVFIDDSDIIFENQREHGLYRYLLTILDGLESESLQQVCIMMTAMELRHIPPALIRSGRVELWLETKLPDESTRAELLRRLTAKLPDELREFDVTTVAKAMDHCSPADLKRLVNDAKSAYAWAIHQQQAPGSWTDYLLQAVTNLKAMKHLYTQARQVVTPRTNRPSWFDINDPTHDA